MQVVVSLSQQVIAQQRQLFREEWCMYMACGLIKQANEKIDRVRHVACSCLITLLHTSTEDTPYLPHLAELREIFHKIPANCSSQLNHSKSLLELSSLTRTGSLSWLDW